MWCTCLLWWLQVTEAELQGLRKNVSTLQDKCKQVEVRG